MTPSQAARFKHTVEGFSAGIQLEASAQAQIAEQRAFFDEQRRKRAIAERAARAATWPEVDRRRYPQADDAAIRPAWGRRSTDLPLSSGFGEFR